MRFIIVIALFLMIPFAESSGDYEIDNIYGDYLIAGIKKEISMDLEDAELVDVLKALSQQTGLNFVSTEAVQARKLTLYFEDVPLRESMDIIFKANNLTYDFFPEAKIFVIKEMGRPTIELKTKVYYLKNVRLENSRLQNEVSGLLGTGPGSGIVKAVEGIVTENGRVVEDPQSNSLVVVDVPSQFAVIDEVVKKLDMPQPKVMIEVEMLDVSKKLVDKLGFKFSNGFTGKFTGPVFEVSFPFGNKYLAKLGGSQTITNVSQVTFANLQDTMEFFKEDTDTRFLARPRILTIANETAEVNLTTDEAIGITTTETEGGATTQEIERTETGTKLRVTPQVNLDRREITLLVEVFTKEATASGLSVTNMTSGNVMNPEERGTKSVIRLRDGETLLIGGLIREDRDDIVTKIPFLGDIPLVGSLFRHSSKTDDERELLVFLTPHIVGDSPSSSSFVKYGFKFDTFREQSLPSRKESINVALDSFSE